MVGRFIKGLFGGSESAGKALDIAGGAIKGIGTWIDERNLTDEERAKMLAAAAQTHLELIKATHDENGIRSVTRRWLAWGITATTCLSYLLAVGLSIAGKDAAVAGVVALSEAYNLGWAFAGVVVFYFGVQIFRSNK